MRDKGQRRWIPSAGGVGGGGEHQALSVEEMEAQLATQGQTEFG